MLREAAASAPPSRPVRPRPQSRQRKRHTWCACRGACEPMRVHAPIEAATALDAGRRASCGVLAREAEVGTAVMREDAAFGAAAAAVPVKDAEAAPDCRPGNSCGGRGAATCFRGRKRPTRSSSPPPPRCVNAIEPHGQGVLTGHPSRHSRGPGSATGGRRDGPIPSADENFQIPRLGNLGAQGWWNVF